MTRALPFALAATAVLLLSACAATLPPPAPANAPAAFRHQPAGSTIDTATPRAWWTLFGDAELDRLQAALPAGNLELRAAAARVAQARALLAVSRAERAPELLGRAGISRADSGGAGSAASQFSAGLDASWEADLWGRLAASERAQEARFRASAADAAAVRLAQQSALAQTYLSLREAEVEQRLLARSVQAYQRSLGLAQARRDTGMAAAADVLQAATQLKTAEVQALEAAQRRTRAEHALALLLGGAPSDLVLPPQAEVRLPEPPPVPALLPATLLQRRPDIAAAQARLQAALAAADAAEAARWPSLVISGTLGQRAASAGDWLHPAARAWSVGANLLQPLFDAGARRAASTQARAALDEADARYRQTVLQAWQAVEDDLQAAAALARSVALQREAVQHAQRTVAITEDQYRVGTVSYLNVVTAQTTALNAERTLLDLHGRQLAAVNRLLANLAGDWRDEPGTIAQAGTPPR